MTIVPLTEDRVPEALALLKTSLQFTGDAVWFHWKHRQSPFGPSPGFVAMEGEHMLGVRLFMPWHFVHRGELFRALRPVDTATLPPARGKGVFRKLTLEGLDLLRGSYDLVFNTPNSQSYPGYRKMGWQDWVQCRGIYFGVLPRRQGVAPVPRVEVATVFDRDCMRTCVDARYLQWRYQMHPVRFYQHAHAADTGVAVDTIRKGFLRVVRVRDFWGDPRLYASLVAGACGHEGSCVAFDVASRLHTASFAKWTRPASRVVFRGDEAIRMGPVCFSLGDIDGRI